MSKTADAADEGGELPTQTAGDDLGAVLGEDKGVDEGEIHAGRSGDGGSGSRGRPGTRGSIAEDAARPRYALWGTATREHEIFAASGDGVGME